MEGSNWSEDRVKAVWEILPEGNGHLLKEISPEDLDPGLFSTGYLITRDNYPTIPYPLINPAGDCLDRVWTQSEIKIVYQPSAWFDEYEM